MEKNFLALTAWILAFCLAGVNALAISPDEAISQISQTAADDGYRFMSVGENGIDSTIRNDLAANDEMYLESSPEGSVTVMIVDADTGKPVKGAQCFLSFSNSTYTVNSDGSHDQISNPFLLFNLGQTPDSGELTFTDTYFYTTYQPQAGESYFADWYSVSFADIVDGDPQITIDYQAQPWFSEDETPVFESIKAALGGKSALKFSELKEILKQTTGDNYNTFLRELFDEKFSYFSDSVTVEVPDKPQYDELISSGKKQLTIGELRSYIDGNRALFDKYVAGRYYRDFCGFTPSYTFDYMPEYEYSRTFKDGSSETRTSEAYLGAWIFCEEGDNPTATGYAMVTEGFDYHAYAYADGYKEGLASGAYIQQDLVDKDITIKIYLSKDMGPLVAYAKDNAVYGTLTDKDGSPIAGAEIRIDGTELSVNTDTNGNFDFTGIKLEDKTAALTVINPDNGEKIEGAALLNGKKYSLDRLPMDLTGESGVYRLSIVEGMGASSSGAIWIVIVLLAIGGAALGIVLGKKKKQARNAAAAFYPAPAPNANGMPIYPGAPQYPQTPPVNPIPVQYPRTPPVQYLQTAPVNPAPVPDIVAPTPRSGPAFCSHCGVALKPDTAFCANCGAKVER